MKRKEICIMCNKNFEVYQSRHKVKYCSVLCKRQDYKSWHAISNKAYIHKKKEKPAKKIRFKLSTANEQEKFDRMRFNFEKGVIRQDDCWGWKGGVHHSGYVFQNYLGKQIGIHKVSWLLHKGIIDEGKWVLHTCDNRICSNPEHLYLGTASQNSVDRENRDRRAKLIGDKHPNAVLNEDKVKEIKEMLKNGISISKIAKKFSCGNGTIEAIKRNYTWKHVTI